MRQPAADHPEFLAEPDRVDDERVAFPVADRIAEVAGIQLVLGWMLTARLHRHALPLAVFAREQEHAIELGLLEELHPVRDGKESHAARRLTAHVRIVEPAAEPAELVKRLGPRPEGDLLERRIRRQRLVAVPLERAAGPVVPESLFAGRRAEVHLPSGQRGVGRGTAAGARAPRPAAGRRHRPPPAGAAARPRPWLRRRPAPAPERRQRRDATSSASTPAVTQPLSQRFRIFEPLSRVPQPRESYGVTPSLEPAPSFLPVLAMMTERAFASGFPFFALVPVDDARCRRSSSCCASSRSAG